MTVFDEHRRLLFAIAYRILGTAADAEDAVQETWLRWSAADRGAVADPRAYLARMVTHQAVDLSREARDGVLTADEVPATSGDRTVGYAEELPPR